MGIEVKREERIEMVCDICKYHETINRDRNKLLDWHIRHWLELEVIEPLNYNTSSSKRERISLCPRCKRKFRKLVMNTKLED